MRLAYLYSRYPVVSQTFCDSEMLALEKMGFDIEIVSLNPPPDSFRHERLARLKAEIHYPPPDRVLNAKAKTPAFEYALGQAVTEHDDHYGKSFKSAIRARNAWHFAPLLKKLGVSHVHVHFANRATHTVLFLKRLGFTFSFTAHAQDFMVDLGSDELLREMAREAEFVITVSDYSRDLLAHTCPDSADKIMRIYNGIELDDFPKAQPERDGPLRLLSVGRLIEFKGFQNLLGAVRALNERGVQVEARIIGEGPMRTTLEREISANGLLNVELLGMRSQKQIQRELAEAHLFVLPSMVDQKGASDILPTVITEAMACGLPVVSTTVAGIPEMVSGGETGLLVPPDDAYALADAIMELSIDGARRKALGDAGRKRAEEMFSLNITAAQLAVKFEFVVRPSGRADTDALKGALRTEAPVVYLMNSWSGAETHLESLADEALLRVIACSLGDGYSGKNPDTLLSQIEFLPDAVVLESHWLKRSAWRHQLEMMRKYLGDAVSGEEFYLQARRAVYLADVLPRRGVKHVHAFRSDAVVCVWLLKKLSGLRTSAAIEESPSLGRAVLARLLGDFDLVSSSDEKLNAMTGVLAQDKLSLKELPTHRELRLGPMRLKLRATPPTQDRGALERGWFDQIVQKLHV